ncbi:hypothetical protein ACC754_43760, partial [Rhizobium johnstonii]
GNMLAGVALGGLGGISCAVFYALHSMLLMTALYLSAGEIARRGGGFSLSALGGLYRQQHDHHPDQRVYADLGEQAGKQ